MSSGEADILIVKVQFEGFDNHASGHFQNLGILDSVEYLESEQLIFQLVDLQSLALVTVVEIIAGQPAVGHWAAGVLMVFGRASYVLW